MQMGERSGEWRQPSPMSIPAAEADANGTHGQAIGDRGNEGEGAGGAARWRRALSPRVADRREIVGVSASRSTASAATWGLDPTPIFRLPRLAERLRRTENSATMGIDPLDAKAAQRQAQRLSAAKGRTFREVAEEFIGRNQAGWRNAKHRQQWRNTLATYVYPFLGNCPLTRSMPGSSYRCSIRSGRRSPKRQIGCAAGSKRCSTPPPCGGSVRGQTRRVERQSRAYPAGSRQGAECRASCRAAP